jgi:hypothetical protein
LRGQAVLRTLTYTACIFLAGVLAGVVVVYGQAPDWSPSRPLVPGVRCLDEAQDLGTVYLTDALQLTFHLTNDSPDETFRLAPLRGGCSCTDVVPEELALPPGQTAAVRAVVDLEDYQFAEAEEPWEFQETLTAYVRDPDGEDYPLRMRAYGLVRLSCRITPPLVSFGTVSRGDTPRKPFEVESLVARGEGVELVSAPDWLDALVAPEKPAGPPVGRVVLTVHADAPYGQLAGRVRFRTPGSSGLSVTRSVQVWAVVVDDIQALPSTVVFLPAQSAQCAPQVVTLASRRGEGFSVEGAEVSAPGVVVRFKDSPSPSVHRYILEVAAGGEGATREASARFRVRTDSGRLYTVVVPVKVYASPGLGGY